MKEQHSVITVEAEVAHFPSKEVEKLLRLAIKHGVSITVEPMRWYEDDDLEGEE